MSILPSLRARPPCAHANAVKGRGEHKISVTALLLRNERGEGLANGLREVTNELASLPDDGEDRASLIVK